MQSPELEFRHELLHRLNKLDTEVELEISPNDQHPECSPNSLSVYNNNQIYDNYGKDYYYDQKHHRECSDVDDQFLRPPLWEDITSSIQNIDPENAIMLGALAGATTVKLEASEDAFLESFSSPLLSPLEIKTEKGYYQQNPSNNNNNQHQVNHNLEQNAYQVQTNYYPHQQNQMNGYNDMNLQNLQNSQQNPQNSQNNNYYSWQDVIPDQHLEQVQQSHVQSSMYGNMKYSSPSNICSPISRLMYVPPLTPPSSDPGSPGNTMQVSKHSMKPIKRY